MLELYYIQDISRCEDALSTLKAMQERTPTPQAELDINRLEKEMELYSQEKLCYEAQILRVGPFLPSIEVSCYLCLHIQIYENKISCVCACIVCVFWGKGAWD